MKDFLARLIPSFLTTMLITLFFTTMFVTSYAFAQDVVAPQDFLAQVLQVIKDFGGLSMMAKIASIVMIVISSMKVSFLSPYWAKLGNLQAWLAPVLGLVAGLLMVASGSGSLTWASAMAYALSGAGAIMLHNLLDLVKAIPGLGPIYVSVIDIIESRLGGPAASAPAVSGRK